MDDMLRDFLAEAAESIEALDSGLVRFEQTPSDPGLLAEIFRVMHTIKGTCGFLNLPRLESVAHAGEDVLGRLRDGELQTSTETVSAILSAIDAIKALLAGLEREGAEPEGSDTAIINHLRAIAAGKATVSRPSRRLLDRLGGLATLDSVVETWLARLAGDDRFSARLAALDLDVAQGALRDALVSDASEPDGSAFRAALNAHFALVLVDAESQSALLAHLEAAFDLLEVEPDARAELQHRLTPASTSPKPVAATDAERAHAGEAAQSIRVSVETLEQLMTVVSELVLIRNQLIQTDRQHPDSPFAAPLQRLNHVTSELQERVMTTRMQPIGNAWAKLPRLVRDLSVELGKKIELTMTGAETELDRQVLDLIKDPLTHMIRNAADHGLEPSEDRRAAGKPETGRISLQARHEGGHIVLEIGDDGRGLSLSRLRAKALEQGLMSPAELETAPDSKIQRLIFHAGLSTAAKVTSVSGRGVGMDVVRTNIEKIGGTIELQSAEGKGTRFTIRIPLTLTIVSALTVECGGDRFAIPQSSVVELVGTTGASRNAIEYAGGAPVLRLRDRLLPLVSLRQILKLDAPPRDEPESCILVTQVGSFSFGIIVDRVFDTEEIVVKPVASILRHIPLFSGNTILGDGSVIMILDPKGIAAEAGASETGREDVMQTASIDDDATAPSPLLVVRSAERWKAVPLSLVSRIEELEPSAIESVEGRDVMQYRGQLIPVIALSGNIAPQGNGKMPMLVFADGDRAFGLLADEIIDIVEEPLSAQLKAGGEGMLGAIVACGRAVDLIDVGHYWNELAGQAFGRPLSAKPARRVLVIDSSPFFRNLLEPMLATAGYRVTTIGSLAEALELQAGGTRFDIILSDVGADAAGTEHLRVPGPWALTPIVGTVADAGHISPSPSGFDRLVCKLNRRDVLAAVMDLGHALEGAA